MGAAKSGALRKTVVATVCQLVPEEMIPRVVAVYGDTNFNTRELIKALKVVIAMDRSNFETFVKAVQTSQAGLGTGDEAIAKLVLLAVARLQEVFPDQDQGADVYDALVETFGEWDPPKVKKHGV